MPGDWDGNGSLDNDDYIGLSNYITTGGTSPLPTIHANADPNGDCKIDASDEAYMYAYVFSGGSAPVLCTCIEPVYFSVDTCDGQMPGDWDGNGSIDLYDYIGFSNYITTGGISPLPTIHANADPNGDCKIDVADEAYMYAYVFSGGLAPILCTCLEPIYSSGGCCVGFRGNVDNDSLDVVDISDLVYLVDFMFTNGPSPNCSEEANVDGDVGNVIDISDLVYLVDFMFNSGPEPPSCP